MDKAFAVWSKQGGTGMWAERTPTRSYNGKGDTLQGRAPGGDGGWRLDFGQERA